MTEFEQFTLQNAIERFGINRQLAKLAEECGELVQAAMKSQHAGKGEFEASLFHLAEEMADVEILIDQFRMEFPLLVAEPVNDWREKKMDRLAQMVEVERDG